MKSGIIAADLLIKEFMKHGVDNTVAEKEDFFISNTDGVVLDDLDNGKKNLNFLNIFELLFFSYKVILDWRRAARCTKLSCSFSLWGTSRLVAQCAFLFYYSWK